MTYGLNVVYDNGSVFDTSVTNWMNVDIFEVPSGTTVSKVYPHIVGSGNELLVILQPHFSFSADNGAEYTPNYTTNGLFGEVSVYPQNSSVGSVACTAIVLAKLKVET